MAGQSRRGQTSPQPKKKRSPGRWPDASETSRKSFHCLLAYSITASVLHLALEQVASLAGQIVLSIHILKTFCHKHARIARLALIAAAEKSVERTVRHLARACYERTLCTGFQTCLPKKRAEKPATHDALSTARGDQIIHTSISAYIAYKLVWHVQAAAYMLHGCSSCALAHVAQGRTHT